MKPNMKKVHELMDRASSGTEVLNMVNGQANLITYSQLPQFNSIDQVLSGNGSCFILYQTTKENYGHWCALIRRGTNGIELFDSYGIIPDDELKWTKADIKRVLNQDYPYLTYLLYKSGKSIEYNDVPLQGRGNIKTCGRWSAARIINKHVSIEEFDKFFTSDPNYTPDELVTIYTMNL